VSNRIVGSPIQLRRVSAHQQRLRIGFGDVASTEHRNPHGAQVARGDLPDLHDRRVAPRRFSLERENLCLSAGGKRQVINPSRSLDARQGANAL
jgi:hypothetical protein